MLTIDVLTAPEQQQLEEQESRIELGFKTFFVAVGEALAAIQEKRLYRASHETFEDYCQNRWANWGISANYARKLIRASKAVKNLQDGDVSTLPTTESQARELAKLDEPAQQIEAWLDAVNSSDDGKPTAAEIQQAVDRVQRRANPTPGQQARVMKGKHEGETVVIRKTENNGALIHASLPNGKNYPFLAGELQFLDTAPTPAPVPKPSLKQEIQQLRELLRRVLAEADPCLSADLRLEIQAALE